jgi:heme-degrading monooxygenase HmoA
MRSADLSALRARMRDARAMILEHAILDVVRGQEPAFESAFAEAKAIIASMPGFRSLRLDRCVEQRGRYLLLVEWEQLQDHTQGFRQSAEYQRWRDLLHHFYEPFPVVEHYEPLIHM